MLDPLLAGGAVLFALIFAVILMIVFVRRWRQRPSMVRPVPTAGAVERGEDASNSNTVNLYSTKPIYNQYNPNLLPLSGSYNKETGNGLSYLTRLPDSNIAIALEQDYYQQHRQ